MPINDSNINAGAKEMVKQLDHATTQNQAEVVADRLRADYLDCANQGTEGAERWRHIVNAMNKGDHKDKGYDVQVNNPDSPLPTLTLFDSQKGITILGVNMGRGQLNVNENRAAGSQPRGDQPIEMK